jgi:hypothetical protein
VTIDRVRTGAGLVVSCIGRVDFNFLNYPRKGLSFKAGFSTKSQDTAANATVITKVLPKYVKKSMIG